MVHKTKDQKLIELGLLIFSVLTILSFLIYIYNYGIEKSSDFLGWQHYVALIWAFFSSYFWLVVIYKQDHYKKESIKTVGVLAFITVYAAFFISGYINHIIFQYFGQTSAYMAVGFVEEGTKILMILFFVYNTKDFDEPMDGAFYAGVTAVAFSFSENYTYYNYYVLNESLTNNDMIIGLLMRFLTTMFHVILTATAGFVLGMYKFGYAKKRDVGLAFFVAAVLHSAYDLSCEKYPNFAITVVILDIVFVTYAFIYLNRISPYNRNYLSVCKNCGYFMRENSVKCPHCDKKVSWFDTVFSTAQLYCTRCQNKVSKKDKSCKNCGFEFKKS